MISVLMIGWNVIDRKLFMFSTWNLILNDNKKNDKQHKRVFFLIYWWFIDLRVYIIHDFQLVQLWSIQMYIHYHTLTFKWKTWLCVYIKKKEEKCEIVWCTFYDDAVIIIHHFSYLVWCKCLSFMLFYVISGVVG